MTIDDIETRLHEAITTLAALPDREMRWVRAKLTSWPETLREAADIMALALERVREGKAAYEAMTAQRPRPTPDQIDRIDAALAWLRWLDPAQKAIVMLRAGGMSFEQISWRLDRWKLTRKVTGETVRFWNRKAIVLIQRRLREPQAAAPGPRPAA